jgi:hypothetical protein
VLLAGAIHPPETTGLLTGRRDLGDAEWMVIVPLLPPMVRGVARVVAGG